jgi:Arc/MetJ-type ribon-helix-helix transcriptional regulator
LYDNKYDHIEDMHMNERVTVTLPEEIIRDIDGQERNRSRFVLQAVKHELERRRKEELRRSLRTPHQDSGDIAQAGFAEWAEGLPEGDEDLVDIRAGESVRWVPGKGWTKEE